jgi:ABC-type branched-subunit amino acid transport system substrate-binding protein
MMAFTMVNNLKAANKIDVRKREVRVGIMLPLHNVDGDGNRMVEFYRGLLLAVDDLKKEGISVDIHAWNVNIDADIRQTLTKEGADKCDIIFGPLYTKQVAPLGEFAKANNIKVVIPFSISSDEVEKNPQIFQVYQTPDQLNVKAIQNFMGRFADYHPIFIDCNDKDSKKGVFTKGLRQMLEKKGIPYNITNLNSPHENFVKAFTLDKPNVVILNTDRSPELTAAYRKLDEVKLNNSSVKISMFGYTEWLMYERNNIKKFIEYDTYVPSTFYLNISAQKTQTLLQDYNRWFKTPMMEAIPRFAITGYDQACFFIRGLHQYGEKFDGKNSVKPAVQTPYRFERVTKKGGYQNNVFQFVHYNTNGSISIVNF